MSFPQSSRPDISGKIAALEPSFRFLSERTGKEPTPDMMLLYAEHFVQQHLMIEAVNETVRAIVIEWEKPYWPSAEYIAIRARQRQRSVMGELHGVPNRQREIDDLCEAVDQRKWDERQAKASDWSRANPDRFKRLVRDIDGDIRMMIASGAQPWLRDVPIYRQNFRLGAAVGGSLRQLTYDLIAAAKKADRVAAERARAAQAADREAMKTELEAAA